MNRYLVLTPEQALTEILRELREIRERIDAMAGTVAELDAALTAYETAEAAQIQEIETAVAAILAKIGPAADLTPEIARIQAATAAWQAEADKVAAAAKA